MATWSGSQLVTRREISRTAGPLGERDPNSAWPGQKIISHFCMIWYDLDIMGMGEASISLPAWVYQLWTEREGYQGVDPTYRKLGGQRGMEISVFSGCRTENGWVFFPSLPCLHWISISVHIQDAETIFTDDCQKENQTYGYGSKMWCKWTHNEWFASLSHFIHGS